jgi:hypothetical protein
MCVNHIKHNIVFIWNSGSCICIYIYIVCLMSVYVCIYVNAILKRVCNKDYMLIWLNIVYFNPA